MIRAENITKAYGKQNILNGVSFSANPGERVAIIGRNGCGKSTLMQILTGILKPDGGSLQYYDRTPIEDGTIKDRKAFRQLCGYVPQANPLMEELNVLDNLKLFGASADVVKDPLLEPFELEPILKKQISKLSGGMKRRVAIACAVYYMPSILFMDEPTTALDIYFKTTIHEWMSKYQEMGGMLIITTHDEQEILSCDRCFMMEEGKLRELSKDEMTAEKIRQIIVHSS